jgi:hypothetical protein
MYGFLEKFYGTFLRDIKEDLSRPCVVVLAYNPSCSGGKDQEDHGSRLA